MIKLSSLETKQIQALYTLGTPQSQLASYFKVSNARISQIVSELTPCTSIIALLLQHFDTGIFTMAGMEIPLEATHPHLFENGKLQEISVKQAIEGDKA